MDDTRTAACEAIENAITATVAHCIEAGRLDTDDMVTDAVLILGAQYIDGEGDRLGRVIVMPRHGSQPPYITVGLLESARRLIEQATTAS